MAKRKRQPAEQRTGRPRAPRPRGLLGSLAAQIEARRDACGLTQPQLAKASGVGLGTIGRLERGGADPKLATVVAIAAALGVRARDLLAACEEW